MTKQTKAEREMTGTDGKRYMVEVDEVGNPAIIERSRDWPTGLAVCARKWIASREKFSGSALAQPLALFAPAE